MSRFVRSWSAISRSLPQFAPARRPHARRQLTLERLEDRTVLSSSPVVLTVNTWADDPSGPTAGYTTLRDAITQADNDPANSYAINFSVSASGTIDLTSPLPDLSNSITLNGPGASNLTVQRDLNAAQVPIFTVNRGAIVSLSGLTISGGDAGYGGGLDNYGTVTVTDSIFSSNTAVYGGGVYNESGATATVSDSTFASNYFYYGGGGIFNASGATASVTGSTFIQ